MRFVMRLQVWKKMVPVFMDRMLIPVLALLEHQMHCATTLEEIYAMVEDQPQETIQATQDYATAMTYCRDEILQQLVCILIVFVWNVCTHIA